MKLVCKRSYQDYDGGKARVYGVADELGFKVVLIGEYGDKVGVKSQSLELGIMEVYERYFESPYPIRSF